MHLPGDPRALGGCGDPGLLFPLAFQLVGTVGQILGEAGVNIAGMQVSRDAKGGQALVALSVDSAVPADVLEAIRASIAAESVRGVDLTA